MNGSLGTNRGWRRSAVAALLGVAAGTACADAPTEPLGTLLTEEAVPALDVRVELPSLDRLIDQALAAPGSGAWPRLGGSRAFAAAGAQTLREARALWHEAGTVEDAQTAARLRDRAYRLSAPPLADRLGPAVTVGARFVLERWLHAADAALGGRDVAGLSARLGDARSLIARAAAHEAAGDDAAALLALLRAADRLAETHPVAVAGRLVPAAESAFQASGAAEDPGSVRRTRAERLVRGAREALTAGDHATAIRRAYYALQLLEAG